MNIVGDLAESWQVVSYTTFVFKLRRGSSGITGATSWPTT